jgi:HEAT repeat protein
MKSAELKVRAQAIRAVGDLAARVRRLLPTLRQILEEAAHADGEDVRAEAVRALLRAGPQPDNDVAALTDALHSGLEIIRFHAAIALGDFGIEGRPAVPNLIHASLWDDEPAVRLAAAMAIWKIDDQRGPLIIHVLSRALGDANELICWLAAEFLGQMNTAARDAVPALQNALRRKYELSVVQTSIRLALERITPQGAAAPSDDKP